MVMRIEIYIYRNCTCLVEEVTDKVR